VNGDGFVLELALVAVLILLNGFFAGAEIAVITARTSRIRPLAERGNRRAASLTPRCSPCSSPEHEAPVERARVLGEKLVDVDASVSVRELNGERDLVLPESDTYVTVAGLIQDRLGAIPRGGEQVEAPPYRLTVVGVDGRRITRARIERVTSTD